MSYNDIFELPHLSRTVSIRCLLMWGEKINLFKSLFIQKFFVIHKHNLNCYSLLRRRDDWLPWHFRSKIKLLWKYTKFLGLGQIKLSSSPGPPASASGWSAPYSLDFVFCPTSCLALPFSHLILQLYQITWNLHSLHLKCHPFHFSLSWHLANSFLFFKSQLKYPVSNKAFCDYIWLTWPHLPLSSLLVCGSIIRMMTLYDIMSYVSFLHFKLAKDWNVVFFFICISSKLNILHGIQREVDTCFLQE